LCALRTEPLSCVRSFAGTGFGIRPTVWVDDLNVTNTITVGSWASSRIAPNPLASLIHSRSVRIHVLIFSRVLDPVLSQQLSHTQITIPLPRMSEWLAARIAWLGI
jgi:hypothetical protein